MNVEREVLTALNKNAYLSNMVLTALWRREQMKEADKVPAIWRPYTVLLPGLVVNSANIRPLSVFPRNPRRSGFSILNNGASPNNGAVLISGTEFDVNEALALLSGTGQGVISAGILTNGAQISIVTSGPLYVYPSTTTPASLLVIETEFIEQARDTSQDGGKHEAYRDTHNYLDPAEGGRIGTLLKELV